MRVLEYRVASEDVHNVSDFLETLVTTPNDIGELLLIKIDSCPLLLEANIDGSRESLLVL